jgi:hypothetical protein
VADGDYRILVTGSRDWEDFTRVSFELGLAIGESGHCLEDIVIVHGGCPTGADAIADRIAQDYSYRVERHPADWERHGKPAGPRRNAEMVALGADICLCFLAPCTNGHCRIAVEHGSHGASHCAGVAEEARMPVRRFHA